MVVIGVFYVFTVQLSRHVCLRVPPSIGVLFPVFAIRPYLSPELEFQIKLKLSYSRKFLTTHSGRSLRQQLPHFKCVRLTFSIRLDFTAPFPKKPLKAEIIFLKIHDIRLLILKVFFYVEVYFIFTFYLNLSSICSLQNNHHILACNFPRLLKKNPAQLKTNVRANETIVELSTFFLLF